MWRSRYGLQEALRAPLGMLSGVAALVLVIVCASSPSRPSCAAQVRTLVDVSVLVAERSQ